MKNKDNVVSFKKHQHRVLHEKKEAGFDQMKQRFETAAPIDKSPKEALLNLFKKKTTTRTPKK
ncbi:MAG: hypothetical protein V7784_18490 [Oceanospirillaceae bacterium]